MKMTEAHPDIYQMFHGTSAQNAQRIVAERGMNPTPEFRHYDEDSEDLASLNGSYFTDSLEAAVGYAYKASSAFDDPGAMAVIVANVPLADGVPDEDVITPALQDALRKTSNPDQFVTIFHRNLVQDRPIPVDKTAALALMRAYRKYDKTGEGIEEYRDALDKVAHAYARMVFDTHPVYLGGNHTVRLPRGLPLDNIVSVTIIDLRFDEDDGEWVPRVESVTSIHGKTISKERIQEVVYDLYEDGFFG